jgi:hypothetical protein
VEFSAIQHFCRWAVGKALDLTPHETDAPLSQAETILEPQNDNVWIDRSATKHGYAKNPQYAEP